MTAQQLNRLSLSRGQYVSLRQGHRWTPSIPLVPNSIVTCLLLLAVAQTARGQIHDQWEAMREAMVKDSLISAGIQDTRVLEAMRTTPRHLFVPRYLRTQAYFDMALPIGATNHLIALHCRLHDRMSCSAT